MIASRLFTFSFIKVSNLVIISSTLPRANSTFIAVPFAPFNIILNYAKLFFWHFHDLLVKPLTQVRQDVGESLHVAHGD